MLAYTSITTMLDIRYTLLGLNIKGECAMKTLRDVPIGETAKVVKLLGEGILKRRIMDMGITKGVEIFVRKMAPLGDPMQVSLRGYELSLRKTEAEKIIVEY